MADGKPFEKDSRKRGNTYEQEKCYSNQTGTDRADGSIVLRVVYIFADKIPMPGGGATSLHIGNAFCVLAALILGGWYGGLAGALGMGLADILDPVYITGAPKTFVLKLCIGLIVGLVAHRIAKIDESQDRKYVFRWSLIAAVAGLGFNVIADPLAGFFYNQYILGQPQQMAEVLAKWGTAATFVNAVVSVVLTGILYNALRPVLLRTGLICRSRIKTA